jgi:hypothetical protein
MTDMPCQHEIELMPGVRSNFVVRAPLVMAVWKCHKCGRTWHWDCPPQNVPRLNQQRLKERPPTGDRCRACGRMRGDHPLRLEPIGIVDEFLVEARIKCDEFQP